MFSLPAHLLTTSFFLGSGWGSDSRPPRGIRGGRLASPAHVLGAGSSPPPRPHHLATRPGAHSRQRGKVSGERTRDGEDRGTGERGARMHQETGEGGARVHQVTVKVS